MAQSQLHAGIRDVPVASFSRELLGPGRGGLVGVGWKEFYVNWPAY